MSIKLNVYSGKCTFCPGFSFLGQCLKADGDKPMRRFSFSLMKYRLEKSSLRKFTVKIPGSFILHILELLKSKFKGANPGRRKNSPPRIGENLKKWYSFPKFWLYEEKNNRK